MRTTAPDPTTPPDCPTAPRRRRRSSDRSRCWCTRRRCPMR
ncbi:MAG: hypothetical protein ACE37B_16050 [Ilumatobacter sp.]